jgi:aminopeptidase
MTHIISIIAEADKYELKGVDPAKLTTRVASHRPYYKRRTQKELEGKLTRTVGMYGTPAMAEDVGMSIEEYREQIIQACYLNEDDPIAKWRETQGKIEQIIQTLNTLKIQKVHIEGEDADLRITIGSNRKWLGGGGRNIPSFEIFTSPDYRETQGRIRFNQPLYRYGQKISGISLKFEKGEVVAFDATEGKELLTEIFALP